VSFNAGKNDRGPVVKINHPPDNTDVSFAGDPLSTPCDGTVDATAVSMAYQINEGFPIAFPYQAGSTNWAVPKLTEGDCSTTNTWYTLTIYAWDKNGGMGLQQSTFRRV
jgi:hypothetical protein